MSDIELAWNRSSLLVPSTWEPGVLERDYFRLEENGRPVLELKWRTREKRFSPEKRLKRIRRSFPEVEFRPLPEKAIPIWRPALDALTAQNLEVELFSFQPKNDANTPPGCGALVFSPQSNRLAVAQFFNPPGGKPGELAAQILSTYQERALEEWAPWSVFDINVHVPDMFFLSAFSFKPGHFRLGFKTGHKRPVELILDRLGPASVLLKKQGLAEWAQAFYKDLAPRAHIREERYQGMESCTLEQDLGETTLRRILAKATNKRGLARARVWTLQEKNKIAAVSMRAGSAKGFTLFEDICERFEIGQKITP